MFSVKKNWQLPLQVSNICHINNMFRTRCLSLVYCSIKHSFAEQQVQYCLIKLLNEDREAEEIIHNIQNQNFCNFKSSLKYKIIASYSDKCVIIDCHTCKIIAENG